MTRGILKVLSRDPRGTFFSTGRIHHQRGSMGWTQEQDNQTLGYNVYDASGITDFKDTLQSIGFDEKQSDIMSAYLEKGMNDMQTHFQNFWICKSEIAHYINELSTGLGQLEEQIDELKFNESSEIRKKLGILNNRVEEAEARTMELIDSLNFYTQLELNEHKNSAKDELDKMAELAEQNQKSSNQLLNKLRVAAEKDKVETAPQILWAVTAILVSLTAAYWLFPSKRASQSSGTEQPPTLVQRGDGPLGGIL